MSASAPRCTTWSSGQSRSGGLNIRESPHLRIEGCGVLVDHPELAGVGNDQREAQQNDQNVDGDQSLLTAGLGQNSEDDKCEQDVEKS